MTPAIRALEAANVPFVLHPYERDDTGRDNRHDFGREAADTLGLDHDRVFKTLVVVCDGTEAVAVVPVSCRLALRAVGAAMGAKRVEMCEPERAERVTGFVVGGISPFGQKRRLTTVVDETCVLHETMFVSGGRRGLDVELSPADLLAVTGALVADITT
jgi:Cys-tRNA(Pro)/Cys-tRNA(Cys) deacylase